MILRKQNVIDFTTLKRIIQHACSLSKVNLTDQKILEAVLVDEVYDSMGAKGMCYVCPESGKFILKSEFVLQKTQAVKFQAIGGQ